MNLWMFLGLKTDNFSSNLKRARNEAKGFEDGWNNLRNTFAVGGLTTIALGFLMSFTKDAQAARAELERLGDPIPGTVAALATLGDGFDQLTKAASTSVGFVLTGWQSMFDLGGSLINRMRGISEAQENLRVGAKKAADEAEARLAKARAENSPEKIAAAVEHLAEVRRRAAIDGAEGEEKLNLLLAENLRLREDVNATGENSIKGAQAREALEKNLLEIKRTDAALSKQTAADQVAADRATEQANKELLAIHDRLAKAKFDSLSAEQQINDLAHYEQGLRTDILALQRAGQDTTEQEAALQETLNDLVSRRAALAKELAASAEREAAATAKKLEIEQNLASLKAKANADAIGFMSLSGLDRGKVAEATDATLKEIVRRTQGNLASLGQAPAGGLSFDDNYFVRIKLQNEINQVRAELDKRDSFRQNYAFQGADAARRNYQGDPLNFDRFVEQYVTGLDQGAQTNRLLEQVRDNLNGRDNTGTAAQLSRLTDATKAVAQQLNQRGIPTP